MSLDNRKSLRILMAEHDLSAEKVAEITGASTDTVYMWMSNSPHEIPDYRLELLKIKLQMQSQKQ